MKKFIGSLVVLFSMLVCSVEARILIGTNGNVVVVDLSLRMPTPQEVRAHENPGMVVPVYPTWPTLERDGFWHGREISRTTNAVVFRDGKMQEIVGQYTEEIGNGFLWYVALGILAMVLMVWANVIGGKWRYRNACVATTATIACVVARNEVTSVFLLVFVSALIVVCADVCRGKVGRTFWSVVYYATMTTAILWGLW